MSETITHISGNTLNVCGRTIQRCSLCGAKLCDSEGTMSPVEQDGSAPVFPTWETGRLIQVTAGNPTQYVLLPDTDKLPDDSCIDFA